MQSEYIQLENEENNHVFLVFPKWPRKFGLNTNYCLHIVSRLKQTVYQLFVFSVGVYGPFGSLLTLTESVRSRTDFVA